MNLEKYSNIVKYINDIEDKEKFLLNVMSIKDDKNIYNTIHITNYEITTKISVHYLNHTIPISRNSNTVSIKSNYASYAYSMTISILLGLNNCQYYSYGEFNVDNDIIYELVSELTKFIENVCDKHDLTDKLNHLKQTINDIVSNMPKEKIEKIEDIYNEKDIFSDKIKDIYDEKYMFSDKIEEIDDNSLDINKNVLLK